MTTTSSSVTPRARVAAPISSLEATMSLRCVVNGEEVEAEVPVRMSLADFLREVLGLTGTHLGCEHGVCGCCNVLFDGVDVRSCLLLAVQAEGHEITTIEGLSDSSGEPGTVQSAFQAAYGLQCGYCTPAMIVSAHRLLEDTPEATPEMIEEAMSGNICRCTGYQQIREAVELAQRELDGEEA